MRSVTNGSLSKLWISVHTMLKDAATLSWLDLVKQVLPSKDSCWLASANRVVMSSSPGEGKTALQTIVLPRICSSSSCCSRGIAWGSPCSRAARAARQPTEAAAVSTAIAVGVIAAAVHQQQKLAEQLQKGGSPQQQLQQLHSSGQSTTYSTL